MPTIYQLGEYMLLHQDGRIERIGDCKTGPSETWYITGAVERNNLGVVTRRYTLAEVLAGVVPWKRKNGAQRCALCDVDHGTAREWGSDHRVAPAVADHLRGQSVSPETL